MFFHSGFGLGLSLLRLRPGFIPVFFHSGFGLGLLLFRLRPGFTPFRVSGSVSSFRDSGFGLGLGLLLFRVSGSGYSFS